MDVLALSDSLLSEVFTYLTFSDACNAKASCKQLAAACADTFLRLKSERQLSPAWGAQNVFGHDLRAIAAVHAYGPLVGHYRVLEDESARGLFANICVQDAQLLLQVARRPGSRGQWTSQLRLQLVPETGRPEWLFAVPTGHNPRLDAAGMERSTPVLYYVRRRSALSSDRLERGLYRGPLAWLSQPDCPLLLELLPIIPDTIGAFIRAADAGHALVQCPDGRSCGPIEAWIRAHAPAVAALLPSTHTAAEESNAAGGDSNTAAGGARPRVPRAGPRPDLLSLLGIHSPPAASPPNVTPPAASPPQAAANGDEDDASSGVDQEDEDDDDELGHNSEHDELDDDDEAEGDDWFLGALRRAIERTQASVGIGGMEQSLPRRLRLEMLPPSRLHPLVQACGPTRLARPDQASAGVSSGDHTDRQVAGQSSDATTSPLVDTHPGPAISDLFPLSGLWRAPYGGHGMEVVHVAIEPPVQQELQLKHQESGTGAAASGTSSEASSDSAAVSTSSGDSGLGSGSPRSGPSSPARAAGGAAPMRQTTGARWLGSGDTGLPTGSVACEASLSSFWGPARTDGLPGPREVAGASVDFKGLRIVGRKVVGDPNVCSGQYTFVASLGPSTVLSPEAAIPAAPVLSFPPHARPRIRHLQDEWETRGLAILPACGQINMNPRSWKPQWMPAALFVWKPAGKPSAGQAAASAGASSLTAAVMAMGMGTSGTANAGVTPAGTSSSSAARSGDGAADAGRTDAVGRSTSLPTQHTAAPPAASPAEYSGPTFSLLWYDRDDMQHMIDFERWEPV